MWLACLAIAVDHISMLQAVQKNQYAKFNIRTGNTMSSYIFNELQMTVLFLGCTVYFREMHSLRRKKNYHAVKYINALVESYLML